MSHLPRTIIELVDTTSSPGDPVAHKAREIRINGTAVLIEADSLHIEFENGPGDPEATKVTMTLLPTEIHFNHDPSERFFK